MQAGTVLDGRYRLIEPIGAGGFGQVWKAHDPNVDRLVAVKVLTSDAGSRRQVARFAREAAVAGGLAHPNIVTVHDFGSATHNGQTCAYLVMELLPGHPLSAALEGGRLPLPKALDVAACVADALEAAHDAGLTHRDIKPSNIMIRGNGKATVVDFGITKGSDGQHDVTTTGVLIGTPAYMAPEALADTFDPRSDLYSLGCVLYEMVTGHRPFTGTSWHLVHQRIKEQPAPLRTLRPDSPVELERFVARLLAKDPAQRPASAGEVWDVLKEINDRHFGATPPSRGKDIIAHNMDITQAEATDGAIIPLRMTAHNACPACATRTDQRAAQACTTCKAEGREPVDLLIDTPHVRRLRPGDQAGTVDADGHHVQDNARLPLGGDDRQIQHFGRRDGAPVLRHFLRGDDRVGDAGPGPLTARFVLLHPSHGLHPRPFAEQRRQAQLLVRGRHHRVDGAVESGAIPKRHSDPRPAQPQPTERKRSTDSIGGPSRNSEVRDVGVRQIPQQRPQRNRQRRTGRRACTRTTTCRPSTDMLTTARW